MLWLVAGMQTHNEDTVRHCCFALIHTHMAALIVPLLPSKAFDQGHDTRMHFCVYLISVSDCAL